MLSCCFPLSPFLLPFLPSDDVSEPLLITMVKTLIHVDDVSDLFLITMVKTLIHGNSFGVFVSLGASCD